MKTCAFVILKDQSDDIADLAETVVEGMVAAAGIEARRELLAALGVDGRGGGRHWKSAVVRAALARGLPELRADLEHEGLHALVI